MQKDFSVQKTDNKRKTQSEFTVSATDSPDWRSIYTTTVDDDDEKISTKISSSPFSEEENKNNYSELYNKCDILIKDSTSELSVIAYYNDNRYLTNLKDVEYNLKESFDRFDSLKNALTATTNFTDFCKWLLAREFQELREGKNQRDINFELPDLKQVRNAISTIISPDARVYFSQSTSAQLMVEWKMETGEKRELLLSQLSSGYRNMLALVMDFARRLTQANPQMENPLAAEAILMIDELDLHLHPTWQQQIIPDLRKVFPNTQIIATTHSPEVVTTVNRHQVWILENYQIKECPSPTKGMKSSDIVTEVLGLLNLRPDTEESRTLKKLFAAIDNGQLEEAQQLRKALQDWESFDSDMSRADMQIRRLERRGKL